MTTIAGKVDRAGAVPRPIPVGPEMAALARFFPDVTWTGAITAGGMGPGTPPMTAQGRGTHQRIQNGRWIVGTYEQEQYLLDGTRVLTWQMHWVAGWDPARGGFRATFADCYGNAGVMTGRIDGDLLIFETEPGAPVRLRLTWDATDAQDIIWHNETSADGVAWMTVETYHMRRGAS